MSWSNGWYFTKGEDKELKDFLEAQNLDEKQIISVRTFLRSEITGKLNLWCGLTGVFGFIAGLFFTNIF